MSHRRWLAGVGTLAALVAIGVLGYSEDLGAPRKIYEQHFAPGDGAAIAERSCQLCHSATLITQQAKDSTSWEKTLGQMEKWGVKLSTAEHDSLRNYLLAHYGPRKISAPGSK